MKKMPAGQSMTGSARRCAGFPVRVTFALLMGIALLSLATLAAPTAHAGGSAPIIHWDSSMIYAGQNNGNPWGPVGENAIVHGANFPVNAQLRLILAPGDSNQDATVCKQPVVTVPIANITTDASGGFTQNFPWPAVAGQVNQAYSICSLLASDSSVASTRDDGPFTVLSSSPPAISLSATTVAVGGTITITGQNWVPPQPVTVNIAGCAACEPGNTEVTNGTTTSAGLNSGSFSLTVKIPSSARPGNYVVDALTPSGLEAFYTTGVKHLTITPATTSNPTPTATTQLSPTPAQTTTTTPASPTPAATKTAIAASGTSTTSTGPTNTNSSNSNGSDANNASSGNNDLVVALIGIALILFLVAALILFFLLRRRKQQSANVGQPAFSPLPPSFSLPSSPLPSSGQYARSTQHSQFNQFAQLSQFNPMSGSTGSYPGSSTAINQATQTASMPGYEQQSGFYPQSAQQQYQPVQTIQTGQAGPAQQGYWQPLQPQSQPQGNPQPQSALIPNCSNCGRPLVPNLPTCATCGMPIAMMRR
jgi:preprotein translocase subunit SecG